LSGGDRASVDPDMLDCSLIYKKNTPVWAMLSGKNQFEVLTPPKKVKIFSKIKVPYKAFKAGSALISFAKGFSSFENSPRGQFHFF
jgi:hypothetical protein